MRSVSSSKNTIAIFGRAEVVLRCWMNARTSAFSSSQLLISSPLENSM